MILMKNMNEKEKRVSCKKVLGQTVCTFGKAIVVPTIPVKVTVYNPTNCQSCNKEVHAFNKKMRKFKGMINEETKVLEESLDNPYDFFDGMPVVDFGNGVVVKGNISRLTNDEIMSKTIESIKNGELVRSFHS